MPDKVDPSDTSKTGMMPRVNLEPSLQREPPSPTILEFDKVDAGAKTGEMPIINDSSDNLGTRDEDTPDGK